MLDFSRWPRFKDSAYRIVELIPEWAKAYGVPEAAIIRQLDWAHGWLESNKRQHYKDMPRFLFNWMRKAQEMNHLKVEAKFPNTKLEEPKPDMTFEEMQNIRRRNYGPL